jgi:hypothetical protein
VLVGVRYDSPDDNSSVEFRIETIQKTVTNLPTTAAEFITWLTDTYGTHNDPYYGNYIPCTGWIHVAGSSGATDAYPVYGLGYSTTTQVWRLFGTVPSKTYNQTPVYIYNEGLQSTWADVVSSYKTVI